jgi:uncharacterized protein
MKARGGQTSQNTTSIFGMSGELFDGPVFERIDPRHGEDRIFAVGLMEDIEIVVVYVMRGKRRRIISARRAHRNEKQEYTSRLRSAGEGQN